MGYDCVKVIEQLVKQDGSRLNDKNTLLDYVRSNTTKFADSLTIASTSMYSGRIASILLIGLDVSNGKLTPAIIDVNPAKFIAAVNGSGQRKTIYDSGSNSYSEKNPVSLNYNKDLKVSSINITLSEFYDMGLSNWVHSTNASFGASTSVSNLRKPSTADCWNDYDKQYAGCTDADKATNDAYEANGITDYAHLFYIIHIIDELSARYGYRVMDPTRPYSPFNWVRVLDNINGGVSTMPVYKMMFLTEFDLYVHSGMINSPDVLTSTFVKSSMFSSMVQSMVSYSTDKTLIGLPNDMTSYQYLQRMHSTLLSPGDNLINGQYIYSKDFAFKLFLHIGGHLFVWKLPITAGTLNPPFLKVFTPTLPAWTRKKDNYIGCCLSLQSDRNLVVYCNPIVSLKYDTVMVASTPVVSFNPVGVPLMSSGTYADKYAYLSSTYNVLITPGGAFVMASPGINGGNKYASLLKDSNLVNLKDKTNSPLDKNDPDCVNGYSLVSADGKSVLASNITAIAENDDKKWCYASIFVKPSKYTTTGMEFDDANLQLIVYENGFGAVPNKSYDVAYNLFNGPFIAKAKSLGFTLDSDANLSATFAYCMRGDRWATDCKDKIQSISSFGSDRVSAANYKISNQLCDGNYDAKYNDLCAFVAPRDAVILSLTKIDPAFGIASNFTSSTYRPYTASPAETMMKYTYTSFTSTQLEYLYEFVRNSNSTLHQKQITYWQQLYAATTGLKPFDNQDFTTYKSGAYSFYTHQLLSALPTVFIVLKTQSAGLYFGLGEMDFPYVSSPQTSYSKDDSFWGRLMLSITYFEGRWRDRSFLPCTTLDISGAMGVERYNELLSQPYDTIQIQITGAANAANAVVYMKSLSIPKVVSYIRAKSEFNTANLTGTICDALPEACYPEILAYTKSKRFDSTTNKWCDVAASATGALGGYISSTNKSELLNACNSAYGSNTCFNASARYKTSFTVTPSHQLLFGNVGERFEHLQEQFSAPCVDACAKANIGDPLYDACRIGSIAYCKTDNNIISDICLRDAKQYKEVDVLRQVWCHNSSNTTNANYATYCADVPRPTMPSSASQQVDSSTSDSSSTPVGERRTSVYTSRTNTSDTPPTSQTSTSGDADSRVMGIICIIILSLIVVGGIGKVVWETYRPKRKFSARQHKLPHQPLGISKASVQPMAHQAPQT
jgi:hypothetical protein